MITIYGLSGKSGTGKSYNASELCRQRGIQAMIDDGLFISENRIVAGISAKNQKTMISAIKTAIFSSEAHCSEVKRAIRRVNPESILILGTSDRMVDMIARRLDLPEVSEHVHKEDITTEEQRESAEDARVHKGTHVIPAPTFQVRKHFSGVFLNPARNLLPEGRAKRPAGDKTVVRPTYSYLGSYEISQKAISSIIEYAAKTVPGVDSVVWTSSLNDSEGMFIRVILILRSGVRAIPCATAVQKSVCEAVAYMTSFGIEGVEAEIRGFRRSK
jgi:uncharacterized alkaline shock family protein YloU/adenylate kinase family enzyme